MGDRTAGGDRVGRVRENTRVDQVARGNKEAADLLDNTQKGDEHLAYINSLPYTVQVGEPPKLIKGMIT